MSTPEQYIIHTGTFQLKSIEDHGAHLLSFFSYIKSPLPLHRSQELLEGENSYLYLWEFLDLQRSIIVFIPSFSPTVHCSDLLLLEIFLLEFKMYWRDLPHELITLLGLSSIAD